MLPIRFHVHKKGFPAREVFFCVHCAIANFFHPTILTSLRCLCNDKMRLIHV